MQPLATVSTVEVVQEQTCSCHLGIWTSLALIGLQKNSIYNFVLRCFAQIVIINVSLQVHRSIHRSRRRDLRGLPPPPGDQAHLPAQVHPILQHPIEVARIEAPADGCDRTDGRGQREEQTRQRKVTEPVR